MGENIMKKLIIIFLLISMIITACGSTDRDIDNDTNVPDTIVEGVEDEGENGGTEGEDINREDEININEVDIAIGLESPDFTLTSLDGEEITLSDYRDKIVIINFWATWCHWCDIEMPDLNRLHIENDDIVVLAVNVMEDENTVREYIEDGGYEFEVVFDTDGKLTGDYLVNGLPNSYFVDKDGILQYRKVGMITNDELLYVVDAIREYHEENNE